jgi:hypothetical protein
MNLLRLARFASMRLANDEASRPTQRQKRVALAIAGVADLVQLGLAPLFAEGALSPFDNALDVIVAGGLVLTLGWRWRTVFALAVELIPGLALFPTWTAMIATLPAVPDPVEAAQPATAFAAK